MTVLPGGEGKHVACAHVTSPANVMQALGQQHMFSRASSE